MEDCYEHDKIEYFLVVSILFYIGNDAFFINQKTQLEKILLDRFTTVKSPFNRADFTCLFFDLLSCPFLTNAFKNKIVLAVRIEEKEKYRQLSEKEKAAVKKEICNHQWFTDWNARDDIAVLLEKKKFITPY
ncbi:MAG: hypothetical protein methR_P1034 [Methyloprofundus sp.]|nr:MAG: hypothetical protein methR_P1034 [Methyloprofundus sp.]